MRFFHWILVVSVLWLMCSVFDYGALNADIQWNRKHRWNDMDTPREAAAQAIGFALLGPLAIPAVIVGTGLMEHGWTIYWRPVGEKP